MIERHGGIHCGRRGYLSWRWWAWAPLMVVGGVQRIWLSIGVYGEVLGQRVSIGDTVSCLGFLDGLGG